MLTAVEAAIVQRMGKEALRTEVHARLVALERRWLLELAPILGRVARRVGPALAHRATKRTEAVQPQPVPWEQSAEEMIAALRDSTVWAEWTALVTAAHREAVAEGRADAVAWLQHTSGSVLTPLDLGFADALAALRDLPPEWSDLEDWMGKLVHGLAYDAGKAIADGLAAGMNYDELLSALTETLGDPDGSSVLTLNELLSSGVSQGSLDRYDADGLELVEILTSPGACEECEALEERNPWPLADADGELPAHINCRCCWAPVA